MAINELINNLTLLLALGVVYSLLVRKPWGDSLLGKVLMGFLFAATCVLVMLSPMILLPGLVFDTRSVVLSLAGLFGGPVVAGMAATMGAGLRIWMGGVGTFAGVGGIVWAVSAGCIFRKMIDGDTNSLSLFRLYLFGLVAESGQVATILLLPGDIAWMALQKMALPMMLVLPVGITVLGVLLSDVRTRLDAERKFKNSERRLRDILDNSPARIYIKGTDYKYQLANQEFLSNFGLTADQVEGRTDYDLWQAEIADELRKNDAEVLETGRIIDKFETVTNKKGEIRFSSSIKFPLRDEGDRVYALCGISADVTERKQAQDRLRRSEAELQALVKAIPDIVVRFDREGRLLFVSGNVHDVLGIQSDQSINRTHREMGFPEELCRFWDTALQQVFQKGELLETEFTFEGPSGQLVFNWRLIPERDGQDAVQSVLSLCRDITSHKKAEREYQTLFREMMDGFALHEIICDDSGQPVDYRFIDVNPAFQRMTGLRGEDLLGRTALEALPGTEKRWIQTYGKVALTGEPVFFEEHSKELQKYFEVTAYRPAPKQFACIFADVTERRLAEEKLHRVMGRLQLAADAAGFGVWEFDIKSQTLEWDSWMFRLFGVDSDDCRDADEAWLNGVHPDDADRAAKEIEQVIAGDKQLDTEFRIVRPDGEVRYLKAYTVTTRDQNGKPVRITGVNYDITEQKLTEKAFKESEEKYRLLAEASMDVILLHDMEGRVLYVNPAGLSITGLDKSQIIGMTIWDLLPESERAEAQKRRAKRENGVNGPFVYQVNFQHHPTGVIVPTEVKSVPIIRDGKTHGVLLVARDITERLETERERAEYEKKIVTRNEFIETLLDNLPIGLAVNYIDKGTATYMNRQFEEIFGWPKEELENIKTFFERIYPDLEHSKRLLKMIMPDFESGDPSGMSLEDIEITDRNGRKKTLAAKSIPLYEQNLMISTVQDVTESRNLQEQLQQAQKMEALGTLAGGIAHDFNNILAAIIGYSELAVDDAKAGVADPKPMREVIRAGNRAKELVKQILSFSRKLAPALRPVNLNKVIREAQSIFERTIPRMISIELELSADLWMTNADASQLTQVVINLGSNAADAMPEGGRLVIETANVVLDDGYSKEHIGVSPGRYIMLTVSDTGHGMDRETREHLFDPFFTNKEVGKGTGMGLATVYGIVRNHNGYINCYSEAGLGTTFKVYLPAIRAAEETEPAETIEESAQGGHETILLVDDEESLLNLGRRILGKQGYDVMTAKTGEDAVDIYQEHEPEIDLIILDISMPGMGGHRCLQVLLDMNPALKVIIASGYSRNGQLKDTMALGASGFVPKPFSKNEMLKTVREVLDS